MKYLYYEFDSNPNRDVCFKPITESRAKTLLSGSRAGWPMVFKQSKRDVLPRYVPNKGERIYDLWTATLMFNQNVPEGKYRLQLPPAWIDLDGSIRDSNARYIMRAEPS